MKIEFVTHSSQDRGTGTQHRAMWGSSRTGPEAEGIGEKCGKEALLWFPGKEQVRQTKQA